MLGMVARSCGGDEHKTIMMVTSVDGSKSGCSNEDGYLP